MPRDDVALLICETNVLEYLKELEDIYTALSSEKNLFPREKVNSMFSRLVHMTHPAHFRAGDASRQFKFEKLARGLQSVCSAGEYQLELYWSQRIVNASDPLRELDEFPYIKNYRELTKLEYVNTAACCSHRPARVLFIGSGPLPLTSYFLVKDYGCEVDNIDISEEAVSCSRVFSTALKIGGRLGFRHGNVFELKELNQYDVVFLAALAGENQNEKEAILKHLHCKMARGALCVIRSAYGLRKLLYPEVSEVLLVKNGFLPVMLIHPLNDVVNSVLIGECVKEL